MRISLEKGNVCAVNVVRAHNFQVSNAPHVADILSNKIYSDGISACIRELSCNAIDSHVEAGTTRRFELKLPDALDRTVSFRDYGTGLSRDDTFTMYTTYGVSTKNDGENADKYIGAFGIGKGSFYCCTNQATITSYFHGRKHIFVCSRDDEGSQQINQLSPDEGYETDEPNGLQISFIYDKDDWADFRDKAEKIFRYFDDNTIPIDANTGKPYPVSKKPFAIEADGKFGFDFINPYSQYNRQIVAVMGNVGYPLDHESIDELLWPLGCHAPRLILYFNIGELDVNAGRESLRYSKKTLNRIKAAIQEFIDTVSEKFVEEIAEIDRVIDYICYLNEHKQYKGFIYHNSQNNKFDIDKIFKEIEDLTRGSDDIRRINITDRETISICRKNTRAYWRLRNITDVLRVITDAHKLVLLLRDEKQYVRKVTENFDNTYHMFVSEEEAPLQAVADILDVEITKISDLTASPVQTCYRGNRSRQSRVFIFDPNGLQPISSNRESVYWKEGSVDFDEGGYYVEINNYNVNKSHSGTYLACIKQFYESLTDRPISSDIYGIKTANLKKFAEADHWIDVIDMFNDEKDKIVKDNIEHLRIAYDINVYYLKNCICNFEKIKNSLHLEDSHLISECLIEIKNSYKLQSNLRQTKAVNLSVLGIVLPNNKTQLEILLDQVYERYPLLNNKGRYFTITDCYIETIRLIDKLINKSAATDFGSQRSPASVAQINAQIRQATQMLVEIGS